MRIKEKENVKVAIASLPISIASFLALGGDKVGIDKVTAILQGRIPDGVTVDDIVAIKHAEAAWDYILDEENSLRDGSLMFLKDIHAILSSGTPSLRWKSHGVLRYEPVVEDGIISYDLISPRKIIEKLKEIAAIEDPIESAIGVFAFIVTVKPFASLNASVAILAANHILINKGAGIIVVPVEDATTLSDLISEASTDIGLNELEDFIKNVWIKPEEIVNAYQIDAWVV